MSFVSPPSAPPPTERVKESIFDLGSDPRAAGRGRGLARRALAGWDLLSEDAILIVSELVGNALRHGAPPVSLLLRAEGRALTITVSNEGDGPMPPEPVLPQDSDESGRGLAIVAALADSLEFSRTRDGDGLCVSVRLRMT